MGLYLKIDMINVLGVWHTLRWFVRLQRWTGLLAQDGRTSGRYSEKLISRKAIKSTSCPEWQDDKLPKHCQTFPKGWTLLAKNGECLQKLANVGTSQKLVKVAVWTGDATPFEKVCFVLALFLWLQDGPTESTDYFSMVPCEKLV